MGAAPGLVAAALALLAGCVSRGPDRSAATPPAGSHGPQALPVAVFADTGRTITLRVRPPAAPAAPAPRAAVWLARVSPQRAEPGDLPPGEPADTLALPPPPALVVDEHLKPPLARAYGSLAVPAGARGTVELDVRVDEDGTVSDVRWAGGSREPALVRAATECARAMRFFPAELAGRPVAVWCRQRFDFGTGGP